MLSTAPVFIKLLFCEEQLFNFMEIRYAFRNMTVNALLAFQEEDFVYDFFNYYQSDGPIRPSVFYGSASYENGMSHKLEWYVNDLKLFEDEIQQVIHTTNQNAINQYFEKLNEYREWLCRIDEKEVELKFNTWNETTQSEFEKKVAAESANFFQHEDRKMPHLFEHEVPDYSMLAMFSNHYGIPKTKKVINYNFFEIKDIPQLLDLDHLPKYIKFVKDMQAKFYTLTSKYIDQYERGKIIATGTTYVSTVGQLNSYNTIVEGQQGNKQLAEHKVRQFKWNRSDIDCLELITALVELKAITNESGNLTRTEAIAVFENLFGMNIKDAESKLSKAGNRKKSRHPFLDELTKKFFEFTDKKNALEENKN